MNLTICTLARKLAVASRLPNNMHAVASRLTNKTHGGAPGQAIRLLDSLPRNAMGKVEKGKISPLFGPVPA